VGAKGTEAQLTLAAKDLCHADLRSTAFVCIIAILRVALSHNENALPQKMIALCPDLSLL
jgi:hypothetical protein